MAQAQTRTPAKTKFSVPEGFTKKSTDIVAYWDDKESGIQGICRYYKVFDSNMEKEKPSVLFIFQLTEPCSAYTTDKDKPKEHFPYQSKKGDLIGVWGKAGMKDLLGFGGVEVYMYQQGEKKTKKPNPMKLYHVHSNVDAGKPIVCIEDTREQSKDKKLFWEKGGFIPSDTEADESHSNESDDDKLFT